MEPFRDGQNTFRNSIALDASTYGDVTVATAVSVPRDREPAMLESALNAAAQTGTKCIPFKSKSAHFNKEDDRKFFEQVITSQEPHISAIYFRHHSASRNEHYIEAVLSAILVSAVETYSADESLVLVDGDETKLDDLATAFQPLGEDSLVGCNCYQAEIYYPQALVADLTAGYLAYCLHTEKYDYADPIVQVPAADTKFSNEWGQAFHALKTKAPSDHSRLGAELAFGQTETDRACIWYRGQMGRTADYSQPDIALDTIVQRLQSAGYQTLAARLTDL